MIVTPTQVREAERLNQKRRYEFRALLRFDPARALQDDMELFEQLRNSTTPAVYDERLADKAVNAAVCRGAIFFSAEGTAHDR